MLGPSRLSPRSQMFVVSGSRSILKKIRGISGATEPSTRITERIYSAGRFICPIKEFRLKFQTKPETKNGCNANFHFSTSISQTAPFRPKVTLFCTRTKHDTTHFMGARARTQRSISLCDKQRARTGSDQMKVPCPRAPHTCAE